MQARLSFIEMTIFHYHTDFPSVNHAYTAVNARRTISRPDPPSSNPAPSGKISWPPKVREYVSRAFMADNLIAGIDNATVSTKLKQVITNAAENSLLESIDWSTYPLPQELIKMERIGQVPTKGVAGLHMNDAAVVANGQISASKKRKSVEMTEHDEPVVPPWRQKAVPLADRVSREDRQGKRQKKAQDFRSTAPTSKFNDLEKRRQRFDRGNGPSIHSPSSRDNSPSPDANTGPVVGTSQSLEKKYFRLTAPPKPETVRPLPILKQTIDFLIRKWKDEHNYGYICDQFKSLRQDLTVQHIKNEFTVRVYEAHARIALEKGDLGEYNQCQTQLRALYKLNLGGCPGEFLAYRIFYFIHTCNRTGMNDVLADLTPSDKQHPAVQHALQVRKALAAGNYHKFFRLYDDPPNMGGYLMDMFAERERLAALAGICRS